MFRSRFDIKQPVLRFKRWSRKGYAAFMSLHRQVSIASLAVEISDRIGKKSSTQTTDLTSLLKVSDALFVTDYADIGGEDGPVFECNKLIFNHLNIESPAAGAARSGCFISACPISGQAFFMPI